MLPFTDIQSWWEVPSIAHFCSLFRAAFDLLDFDIEELEEALLTDGTEDCASSLLTELIVRLLSGCLGNNDISASNYQMFLRRLFRQKCQESGHSNIFNADIDFQFLPLRRKVQILQALCDFRLAAEDVFDLLKNLEAESLRVEPLGWDDNSSAYWYFYGTRLYREDFLDTPNGKRRRHREEYNVYSHNVSDRAEDKQDRIWQVVCFTESDWIHLADKFKNAFSRVEKDLYVSLSENFIPEIPRLFLEKERIRRKRLLESMPRRTSSRVQIKNKQKEEEEQKQTDDGDSKEETSKAHECDYSEREHRARQRELKRSHSVSSSSDKSRSSSGEPVASVSNKHKKKSRKKHHGDDNDQSEAPDPKPSGRQTNNSLACATGQIVIPDKKEQPNSTRKKLKTSQIFGLMEEDVQTDMYKVLDQLKAHEDAWPFMDPVEEEYAPNYYSVIRRPMDLQRMEDRLEQGFYTDFTMFQSDFNLIVNNCRLYNGQDNEYTEMVDNLETAFTRLTQRYFEAISSSDEEIAIEYPIQNPPKKSSKREKPAKKPEEETDESGKRKRKHSNDNEPEEGETSSKHHKSSEKKAKIEKEEKNKDTDVDSEHSHSHSSSTEKNVLKKKKRKAKSSKNSKKKHRDKHARKEKRKHSKHLSKKNKKKRSHRSSNEHEESEAEKIAREAKYQEEKAEQIFYKDKYDEIKQRRSGFLNNSASKEKDNDSKTSEKASQNLSLVSVKKHSKSKEKVDKIKTKNEKKNDTTYQKDDEFNISGPSRKSKTSQDDSKTAKTVDNNKSKQNKADEYEFTDDMDSSSESNVKKSTRSVFKKGPRSKASLQLSNIKNESATEALEQAAKEFCELFDDPPKQNDYGSSNDSPACLAEDYASTSKYDGDFVRQNEKEKSAFIKKSVKKQPINKDIISKITSRRKEIQRTIERLQPGKTKGNLISNVQMGMKQEESVSSVNTNKGKEVKSTALIKIDECESPKLSLGTVLDSVGFGIEKQHNFTNETAVEKVEKREVVDTGTMTSDNEVRTDEESCATIIDVEVEYPKCAPKSKIESSKVIPLYPSQEKATPNLSAWFKAFGAPKGGSCKKKPDESDAEDSKSNDTSLDCRSLVVETSKGDQANLEEFNTEDGESTILNNLSVGRVRRLSTGSSVSERSSFSQDLDSPRHQPSHNSPLTRSPASPRLDDHQKNIYPPLNGTVRVGFYQDTASVKSSPEKSCSPRDAPQSPYASYSQHVYAVSSNAANQTINEAAAKNPLAGFGQSYYDSKLSANRSGRPDDYSMYAAESIYKDPNSPATPTPYSPAHASYSQHSQHSPYAHVQHSPQTFLHNTPITIPSYENKSTEKPSMYPVKKRSYTEIQHTIPDTAETYNVHSLEMSHPANKQLDLSMMSNTPLSYDIKGHNGGTTYVHNSTSVITSTNNSMQKVQYAPISCIEALPNYENMQSKSLNKSMKEQMPGLRDPYADINSAYSMLKKQHDFNTIGRHKKPYHDSSATITKHSQISGLDLKCSSYSTSKPECTVTSADYSCKTLDNASKSMDIDPINMSYLMATENKLSASSAAKMNMLSKAHRSYDLYNMVPPSPYSNLVDINTMQSAANLNESNQRYVLDKFAANLQYQNIPLDTTKRLTEEMLTENYKKRNETMSKSNYPDTIDYSKNLMSDWKLDCMNKGTDLSAYSSYRHLADVEKSIELTGIGGNEEAMQSSPSELRIPMYPQGQDYSSRIKNSIPMHVTKPSDVYAHAALNASTSAYKPPNCHPPLGMDSSLRNLSSLQLMDRYKEERLLSYQASSSSPYEKSIPLAHLYPKNVHSSLHAVAQPTNQIYPTTLPVSFNRDQLYLSNLQPPSVHNVAEPPVPVVEPEKKTRSRKKKVQTEAMTPSTQTFHSYAGLKAPQPKPADLPMKTPNIVPGSAFNFGTATTLPTGLYGDPSNFLEDLRNTSANTYANYMAATAAVHQHTAAQESVDKISKSDHQSSIHPSANPYRFFQHPPVRPGFSFLEMDPASPLYPQFIQRHQEELLRHPSSQMMGIFPTAYQNALGVRPQYDAVNRNNWL